MDSIREEEEEEEECKLEIIEDDEEADFAPLRDAEEGQNSKKKPAEAEAPNSEPVTQQKSQPYETAPAQPVIHFHPHGV